MVSKFNEKRNNFSIIKEIAKMKSITHEDKNEHKYEGENSNLNVSFITKFLQPSLYLNLFYRILNKLMKQ